MSKRVSRRGFIAASAASAAFSIVPRHVLGAGQTPPSEKINIAAIGAGRRAGDDISEMSATGQYNFVAMADVDHPHASKTFAAHPEAKVYTDFRKMLDEVEKSIDVVLVGTPAHTHAVAAINAMKRGKHVYCEKPLAHSIWELREMMRVAKETKVITQLGNQGHSFASIRMFVEWIWDGAIGNVHTIHAGSNFFNSALDYMDVLKTEEPVPATLDWDLWLGPAQFRPYHSTYVPARWRPWIPFGTGTIGDWTCHVIDPVYWALDLGAPYSIQATTADKEYDAKKHGSETFPRSDIITFKFAAKGNRGPVTIHWYDGKQTMPRPEGMEPDRKIPPVGAMVLGDKGGIYYGSHGANGARLFPETKMRAYQEKLKAEPVKKTLPRLKSHQWDFIDAVRSGKPAGSDFAAYGGPLTQIALLGVIGIRCMGQELLWDNDACQFTNSKEANSFIRPEFRKGWTL
jgi:predicted dehydrogenase